jgi:hypothetical protein
MEPKRDLWAGSIPFIGERGRWRSGALTFTAVRRTVSGAGHFRSKTAGFAGTRRS